MWFLGRRPFRLWRNSFMEKHVGGIVWFLVSARVYGYTNRLNTRICRPKEDKLWSEVASPFLNKLSACSTKSGMKGIKMLENFLRTGLRRLLTKERDLVLRDRVPALEELGQKFQDIAELGLYLHIPFCERICPYCPYNKEIYTSDLAE